MAEPTPQELANAAQKQDAMKQAQAMAEQMNLVAQFLDAGLRLFVPHPLLQADVLSSLAAGQCVRNGLKDEQIVSSFRTKCMYARRAEKLNEKLSAEVPEVIPDTVAQQVQAVSASIIDADGNTRVPLQLKIVGPDGKVIQQGAPGAAVVSTSDAVGPGAQPHDDPELETAPLKVSIDVASGKVTDVSDSPIIKP